MRNQWIALWTACVLGAVGCENYDPKKESISSGKLKVAVDESYSLMMDSQVDVFESVYKNADVEAIYKPEADVLQDLLNDSVQAAILSRPLNDEEMAYFKSRGRLPESVRIAVDGVALIVSPSNKDSVLTLDQLRKIFNGEITTWSQVSPGSSAGDLNVVFDNNKSCNARYIRDRFLAGGEFPSTCFAVNSNEEVIRYVNENEGALGIISVSWISDRDDSTSQAFLEKVRVVGILDPSLSFQAAIPRRPYQAYIYDQSYPLRRDVYAIRSGLKGSLGTGFVSFLSGEKGQLIIHKMGMVAATAPVRTIKITE